jgi:hypothetical protein
MNYTTALKRKAIMKTVQFSPQVTVLETYSSDEYDRSDIFSAPVLYKLNPTIKPPQLSLTIDDVPNLIQDDVSSAEASPNTPPAILVDHYFVPKKHKKRPMLSVNTTMCADPLFFTNLSTNYKHENGNNDSNDFLVPVSAIAL